MELKRIFDLVADRSKDLSQVLIQLLLSNPWVKR
jgi:hypothetical protein